MAWRAFGSPQPRGCHRDIDTGLRVTPESLNGTRMKKRGLKFFVLQTLAHQLQRWADIVSRQLDDEKTGVENATFSTSASTEDMITITDIDGPPAHWLARVQKA